jgi:hypothetical protein
MVQKITLKTILRKVVLSSSIFALALIIFVYLIFSQSDSSMANNISEKADERVATVFILMMKVICHRGILFLM